MSFAVVCRAAQSIASALLFTEFAGLLDVSLLGSLSVVSAALIEAFAEDSVI